jgi:hypothetical protein
MWTKSSPACAHCQLEKTSSEVLQWAFLRLEKCYANKGLAYGAGFTARVGSIVRGLASECRQPEYGENRVYDKHDIGVGCSSCPFIPRCQS